MMETLLSIALGIGLAAAAGFRVFVPLFALSLAGCYDILPMNEQWQWLNSPVALTVLAAACIIEALAYLIPWFDNVLDTLAIPLAGLAGTAIMASTAMDLPPVFTWALAIIGGGGAAATIKGVNASARATSTVTTGGIANPIISIGETISAIILAILSIFAPFLALAALCVLVFVLYKTWQKIQVRRNQTFTETL